MLNSKLMTYCFKKFYAGGGLGNKGYRYKKVFLEKLPIKPYENEIELEDKVELILESNKKILDYEILLERYNKDKVYDKILDLEKLIEKEKDFVRKLDYEIDKMVYELYELTEEEINLIEENKL